MDDRSVPPTSRLGARRHACSCAELMFVNYGANMTYVAGLLTPIYYDILEGQGRLDHRDAHQSRPGSGARAAAELCHQHRE
ncbi:MAG: hypothetical protein R3A10_22475 [Caldilineaceae bacterium]